MRRLNHSLKMLTHMTQALSLVLIYTIPMMRVSDSGSVNESRHDKTNKMRVRPAKTQISHGSESSLCAQWVATDPRFLHADSEDSDQTGRMPRLI